MIYPLASDFCVSKFRHNSEAFLKASGWKESSCSCGSGPYVTFNYVEGDQKVTVDVTRKMSADRENMHHVFQVMNLVKNIIDLRGDRTGRIVSPGTEVIWEKDAWGTIISISHGHPNEYRCDYDLYVLWRIPR